MTGFTLTLCQQPSLRVDLRGVLPSVLAGLSPLQVAHLPVVQGRDRLALGEFFDVSPRSDDQLVLDGDLQRFDRVGWQLDAGHLHSTGAVGDHAGGAMTGGRLQIDGNAGHLAGCEMAGGELLIGGNVGDFAGGNLPGSMDGMRGGLLRVQGHAGQRLGDRMRRGSLIVCGDAGDFVASRMVAGTLAVGGRVGAHPGYGMRRGSLVLCGTGPHPAPSPTFVPAIAEAAVFWQLLARDLARLGGAGSPTADNPFAGLAGRRIQRHLGDLAAAGQGELILVD